MSTLRSPIGELAVLAEADDVDRSENTTLDLTGASACIILQVNDGTDGTAGIDVIEFSRDGGVTWQVATAALIGQGHAGLTLEDGTAAAAADGILNAADVEPAGCALFSLGPVDGPFMVRAGSETAESAGAVDWVDGSPSIIAIRIG